MAETNLKELEREVEAARVKLTGDLSTLRSPATAAEFTDSLKEEAIEAKDAILDKAKNSVQSSVDAFLEDIKGRVAANPAAALAIGAGIAWRLTRYPPVATTLVGAGLFSLIRTQPVRLNGGTSADYLVRAKDNLLDQAGETARGAMTRAAAVGEAVSEKLTGAAAEIGQTAQRLSGEAASAAREAAKSMQKSAGDSWDGTVAQVASDKEARDSVLLGAAGLAVLTALGIACQRRLAERD